jgi:CBS domain-containing protein
MTRRVISVAPEASILESARLMLQHRVSGLPVIDAAGSLVGVVTEGDFLRRVEVGTELKRPRWLEFIVAPGRLASEYVHSHGRKVVDVMTDEPVTVDEDTPIEEVVRLMEERRIKRLPVVRGTKVVGIVSRADLLHALASVAPGAPLAAMDDHAIRDRVLAELAKQAWAKGNFIDVTVRNGAVELRGVVTSDHQREAATVVAENIAGVKKVANHLAWIEPLSGMLIDAPDAEREPKSAA